MAIWNLRVSLPVFVVVVGSATLSAFFYASESIAAVGDPTDLKLKKIVSNHSGNIKSNPSGDIDQTSGSVTAVERLSGSTAAAVSETVWDQHTATNFKFSYDREAWNRQLPRIVIMSGPHKTASSTLQEFVADIAALTVSLGNTTTTTTAVADATAEEADPIYKPLPGITEWVFPVGVAEDYYEQDSLAGGLKKGSTYFKFYAILASHISGRRINTYYRNYSSYTKEEISELASKVDRYFRSLFRRPWEDGKKIVIAAEAFDTLAMNLLEIDGPLGSDGEDQHVSKISSTMIDNLFRVLPFDDDSAATSTKASEGAKRAQEPLRLEDIEVQINYRIPRIDHVISVWHQLAMRRPLRTFLSDTSSVKNLYQTNSLALALQYVRRGIRTTLIDMKGARAHEGIQKKHATAANNTDTQAVGGLRAIVACDILRLDKDALCDAEGQLRLPGYEISKSANSKKDRWPRFLTNAELEEIDRLLVEYDCGIWEHLAKYQARGLLRVLYPSEGLFESCNNTSHLDSKTLDFYTLVSKIQAIAKTPVNPMFIEAKKKFDKKEKEKKAKKKEVKKQNQDVRTLARRVRRKR